MVGEICHLVLYFLHTTRPEQPKINQPHIVVPYHQGLSENFKRICKKYGVQVHLKGGLTIKNLLMAPKDKDTIWKKSGVIYRYKCNRVDCEKEYIGESARNFAERFKEHLKTPSPIHDHSTISGHNVTIDNFEIVGREGQNLLRTIKEAPLTKTLANTICHTYGMRFCITSQNLN